MNLVCILLVLCTFIVGIVGAECVLCALSIEYELRGFYMSHELKILIKVMNYLTGKTPSFL